MSGQKRDRSRVKIIDWHIREHYPEKGPDYVADLLGESRSYIMSRAHYLKVPMKKKPGSGKTKAKQPTKEDLKKENLELKAQNKALRLELIKFTDRKRKA
ncbi:MAG: hypothetical protein PQJ59_01710 [Spirochaetales bacterium]|nr:hypothetical protein [Spirochaetales bacterium]